MVESCLQAPTVKVGEGVGEGEGCFCSVGCWWTLATMVFSRLSTGKELLCWGLVFCVCIGWH